MTEVTVTTSNLDTFISELAKTKRGIKKAAKMALDDAIQLTAALYKANLTRLKHTQPAMMRSKMANGQ